MKTLLEINKAINNTIVTALDGQFKHQVPLLAEDLSEPIVRPSVKVAFEYAKSGKYNSCSCETKVTYRIYFFPNDKIRPKAEIMHMQGLLTGTFIGGIEVDKSFYIPVNEVSFVVSDGILICTIELYAIEILSGLNSGEIMEELSYGRR